MHWEVTVPSGLTAAMKDTLNRVTSEGRVTGWAKREHGAYLFNVSGDGSHPGREVVIGPRGGIHSDTQVDFDRKKAQREEARGADASPHDPGVYSKDGRLIGLRLW